MSILQRLFQIFDPPLVLWMQPAEGGVQARFLQRERPIDVFTTRQASALPPTVVQLLKQQAQQRPDQTFQIPFPTAQYIIRALQEHPLDALELRVDAITQLQATTPPAKFAIHWALDPQQWTLHRELNGAEVALGGGWFKRGRVVWDLNLNSIPAELHPLLLKKTLIGSEVVAFLTEVLPRAKESGLPFTTDAQAAAPGQLRLQLVKMLERSLDVRFVSDMPGLIKQLVPMPNAPEYLVSGNTLFPNFGSLPARHLALLMRGETARLTGDALPEFIQEVLRPNATLWGIDQAALDAQYPLLELGTLKPHWQLEHQVKSGVGSYRATLHFSKGQESLAREVIRDKVRRGGQYLRAKQGWIVLSPQIANRLSEIDQRFGEDFTLDDSEVLGLPSMRLSNLDLHVPALETLAATNDTQQALKVLNDLRMVGLPAGLAGFDKSGVPLLIAACRDLFADYPEARILWVIADDQPKATRAALESQFAVISANRPGDFSRTGAVFVTDRYHDSLHYTQWTAAVFENVERLLTTADFAGWAGLPRIWTLFAGPSWMTSPNAMRRERAYDLMRLVRMSPSAFDQFWKHCIQPTAPPASSVPSAPATPPAAKLPDKLATTFKQIVLGNAPEVPSSALPIPPRVPPPSASPQPAPSVFRPQFESAPEPRKTRESFVSQAKRLANRTEASAEPVYFLKILPTYADMTPDQQRWYFYWRTQVRAGNWLPIDLNYLFVYAYEIINLIGFETPQAASEQLNQLWQRYRQAQPQLDGYLIDWIADLSAFFKLPQTPLDWFYEVMHSGVLMPDSGLMFEAWHAHGQEIEAMPVSLLYMLAKMTPTASKFYQQQNANGVLDQAFLKSVAAVDRYLRQGGEKGLFDLTPRDHPRDLQRVPFLNAPNEYPQTPLLIAEVHFEPEAQPLLALHLQSIIKHTENILRARAAFKGKLRGVDLPEGWAAVIERAQVIRPTQKPVALDPSRIERLKSESSDVRAMLTVEEAEAPVPTPSTETSPMPPDSLPEDNFDFVPVRPADAPDGLLTELRPIYELMGSDPKSPVYVLFAALRQAGWKATPNTLQTALGTTFLSPVIDQVNEKAQALMGDFILFEENGVWVLSDDFCDEVEYLLDHAYTPPHIATVEPDYTPLGENWAAFAKQLQPVHWRILETLLAGANVQEVLNREALAAHTMPSVLIEALNTAALDQTGDLIIDTMEEPPALLEDAVDSIRQLLSWAVNQPALVR